jgi:hypothetical protein
MTRLPYPDQSAWGGLSQDQGVVVGVGPLGHEPLTF